MINLVGDYGDKCHIYIVYDLPIITNPPPLTTAQSVL
jgi:hypothetical protein